MRPELTFEHCYTQYGKYRTSELKTDKITKGFSNLKAGKMRFV